MNRYDDALIVEQEVFSGNNFNGYASAPPVSTLVATDFKRTDKVVVETRVVNSIKGEKYAPTVTASGSDYIGLGIPIVSIDTYVAPVEVTQTLTLSSGRGSPAGEHLIITERVTQTDE